MKGYIIQINTYRVDCFFCDNMFIGNFESEIHMSDAIENKNWSHKKPPPLEHNFAEIWICPDCNRQMLETGAWQK